MKKHIWRETIRILSYGFPWEETKEGLIFWSEVCAFCRQTSGVIYTGDIPGVKWLYPSKEWAIQALLLLWRSDPSDLRATLLSNHTFRCLHVYLMALVEGEDAHVQAEIKAIFPNAIA